MQSEQIHLVRVGNFSIPPPPRLGWRVSSAVTEAAPALGAAPRVTLRVAAAAAARPPPGAQPHVASPPCGSILRLCLLDLRHRLLPREFCSEMVPDWLTPAPSDCGSALLGALLLIFSIQSAEIHWPDAHLPPVCCCHDYYESPSG